jgi:hypothetical protein
MVSSMAFAVVIVRRVLTGSSGQLFFLMCSQIFVSAFWAKIPFAPGMRNDQPHLDDTAPFNRALCHISSLKNTVVSLNHDQSLC